MSICPNVDGYSVYLDGEIPEQYDAIYKEHLENCAQCKSSFSKMRKVQKHLRNDAKTIQLTETELKESYANLQKLIQFKDNTKGIKRYTIAQNMKQALPAIAAALIIGIFIPVKFKQVETDNFVPTLHTINPTAQLITSKGIIADISLSKALQTASENESFVSLQFNNEMVKTVDVFRPATLNESKSLNIKIFDRSDSLPSSYSGLYQASFFTEGRFQP